MWGLSAYEEMGLLILIGIDFMVIPFLTSLEAHGVV